MIIQNFTHRYTYNACKSVEPKDVKGRLFLNYIPLH